MGIITVAKLEPDMVMAEDLESRYGRFLLAKGTVLTSKHIKTFRTWGVVEVDIEGISQADIESSAMAQLDPATIETAEVMVRERFQQVDLDHPVNHELFRLCALRKANEIQRGEQEGSNEYHEFSEADTDDNEILESTTTKMKPHEFIRKDIKLSTLPTIFMQIDETIKKPDSSAKNIANVIGGDPNLSAQLLRIVNSAFYGFPSRIDTLSRAVAIIGTRQLSTLAMGVNIISTFKNIPSDLIDMGSFWKHSISCGVIARILAGYKNIVNTERLFVAGLLHDIGRLLFYNYAPAESKNSLLKAKLSNNLLHKVEHETIGFDHAEIGALLLKKWKLPVSLETIVKYHHNPKKARNPLETAVVHLADIMTNALGMGSSGERFVPPLDPDAWETIGLSVNILGLTIDQMDPQVEESFRIFR